MKLSQQLVAARNKLNLTQSDVAEKLGISFQAVSLWERGETLPELDKLVALAEIYQVSTDWLLTGKTEEKIYMDFQDTLSDRLFDEGRMYTYVKTYAAVKNMLQTSRVLPYARTVHEGQVRKGKDAVPYIYHPLLLACHAVSLGMDDDNLVSAALLHDVCEDCNVTIEELPVNEETSAAVVLLTKDKTKKQTEAEYYDAIAKNPIATMVKLLDRCNNISGMAAGFSKKKIAEYIKETEQYVFPLMQRAKSEYPQYSNQIFVLKYHMRSVMEALKHQC